MANSDEKREPSNNLKMGNEESKSQVHHNGDTHVEIVNTQATHTEKLNSHELMLWYIIAITSLTFMVQIVSWVNTMINKRVTKKARSMLEIADRANSA